MSSLSEIALFSNDCHLLFISDIHLQSLLKIRVYIDCEISIYHHYPSLRNEGYFERKLKLLNYMANQVRPVKEISSKRKIFFKNGSCSMLLFKDIDASNAQVRVNFLKRVYPDWRGQFVITR